MPRIEFGKSNKCRFFFRFSSKAKDLLGDDWVQKQRRIVQQNALMYKRESWKKVAFMHIIFFAEKERIFCTHIYGIQISLQSNLRRYELA